MGLAVVGLLSAIGAILGFKFLSGGGHNHHDKNAGMYHHHFGRPSYDTMGGTGHAGSMKFDNKRDDSSCLPCTAKRTGLY